jgi:hypothetical protein
LTAVFVLPPAEAGLLTFLQAVDGSYLCSIDGWASVLHMAMSDTRVHVISRLNLCPGLYLTMCWRGQHSIALGPLCNCAIHVSLNTRFNRRVLARERYLLDGRCLACCWACKPQHCIRSLQTYPRSGNEEHRQNVARDCSSGDDVISTSSKRLTPLAGHATCRHGHFIAGCAFAHPEHDVTVPAA